MMYWPLGVLLRPDILREGDVHCVWCWLSVCTQVLWRQEEFCYRTQTYLVHLHTRRFWETGLFSGLTEVVQDLCFQFAFLEVSFGNSFFDIDKNVFWNVLELDEKVFQHEWHSYCISIDLAKKKVLAIHNGKIIARQLFEVAHKSTFRVFFWLPASDTYQVCSLPN